MKINKIEQDPNDPNKLVIDFTYTPVQPVQYINMTINTQISDWRSYLRHLEDKFSIWSSDGNAQRDEGLKDATKLMQEQYPGKYIVKETYSPALQRFCFFLKFDSPKDETWFMIRHP